MDSTTYSCPGCGSSLTFSIEQQLWACEFCKNTYELADLKARETDASSWAQSKADVFGSELHGYRCQSCGAEILAEKNTAATFCAYCRSPAILPTQLGAVRKPNYILPFKIGKEDAVGRMLNACKGRPFLPSAFRKDIQHGEISGLYVPFWLFSCDARGYLEAEGDIITRWSDSRYRYVKTDTYHVIRDADMHVSRVPVDASDKMDDSMMRAIEPFDYGQMEPFALQYLSGHYADSYDMTPEQAIPHGERKMNAAVEGVMDGLARQNYTVFRRRRMDVYKRETVMNYAMLPVWTFVHTFKNKKYVYSINGQTGKINGRLPISPLRVLAWLGTMTAIGAVAAFFIASWSGW